MGAAKKAPPKRATKSQGKTATPKRSRAKPLPWVEKNQGATELRLGDLLVRVRRHTHLSPDESFTVEPWLPTLLLNAKTASSAKQEAVEVIRAQLVTALEALEATGRN